MEGMETAPSSVMYGDQLPLGISAKSQRRLFLPATGDSYANDGSNICRIDINADSMLDTAQSYLMFTFRNDSADNILLDGGQPLISRLRVESGGVVLEDIQNYNHLVGGILQPANAGVSNLQAQKLQGTLTSASPDNKERVNGVGTLTYGAVATAGTASNGAGAIANATSRVQCYKLHSALLDNDKYLPLVLMNAGLTIEIEWDTTGAIGITNGASAVDWTISAVRYVAHLVDLDRSFYDRLRLVQQNSGGVLQIAGQSFRSFSHSVGTADVDSNINIPCRVKSIKSIFWKSSRATANTTYFDLTSAGHINTSQYQLRIGATTYPPTAVNVNAVSNKIEPYMELQKAWGKLGSNIHADWLSGDAYLSSAVPTEGNAGVIRPAPFGIDLESFRHEIENGVDTASRSLPMTLQITHTASGADATCFIFVLFDSLFYVNMDGSVSVSN